MWFFMNTCYLLSLLSAISLLIAGLQGYFQFSFLGANHPTFALLAVIVYLFTETLIIFFFVGIGVSIKEFLQTTHADSNYHKRSLAIKRKVYPPMLLNMLLVMVLFISGGAVDTGHLAGWIHGLLFCGTILHFFSVLNIQHQSFKESTAIVLEMSGISRTS